MPDAFEALRRPLARLAPDPGFAARLRARLHRELTQGGAMTTRLTPYLAVSSARDAIDWYVEVLGATPIGEPIVMPDGRIGHAALDVHGAQLFLSDEHPEIGVTAPAAGAGAPVSLHLEVTEVDALVARAAARDAVVEREPSDNPYGRVGVIRDPFGHRWMLNAPPWAPEPAKHGDLVHVGIQVPDASRASAFYAAVLGWELSQDERHSYAAAQQNLSLSIWDGEPSPGVTPPDVHPVWTVDDIEVAVAAVRDAGGSAGEIETRPYGRVASCVDDQGLGFSLHQDPPGTPTPTPQPQRQGDVEYVTLRFPDETAAAVFYGAVLGWRTAPGHVPHGLQLVGPTPPGGIWGGDSSQRVQLMFRVADVASAVERVRAGGGTAGEIEQMPYGRSVDCVDDQGMRFWLLQP